MKMMIGAGQRVRLCSLRLRRALHSYVLNCLTRGHPSSHRYHGRAYLSHSSFQAGCSMQLAKNPLAMYACINNIRYSEYSTRNTNINLKWEKYLCVGLARILYPPIKAEG